MTRRKLDHVVKNQEQKEKEVSSQAPDLIWAHPLNPAQADPVEEKPPASPKENAKPSRKKPEDEFKPPDLYGHRENDPEPPEVDEMLYNGSCRSNPEEQRVCNQQCWDWGQVDGKFQKINLCRKDRGLI